MTTTNRVVLDATAFIKGWLIATTLWVGVMLVVALLFFGVPTVLSGSDAEYLWGAGLSLAFYGYGIALLAGAPLGWVLAYLLRTVQKQRIHIGAFFLVPTLVFWAGGGLIGFGWHPGWLGLWATVGAAAAVGRWVVRKDVTLVSAAPESLYP